MLASQRVTRFVGPCAIALWSLAASAVMAQETVQQTVIVGGGLPAVEVDSDALYGILQTYPVAPRPVRAGRAADGLPLFDDSAGPPRSKIISGAGPSWRPTSVGAAPTPLSSGPIVLRPPKPRIQTTTVARAVPQPEPIMPEPIMPEPVPTPTEAAPVTQPPPPARVEPRREPEPAPKPVATPKPEPKPEPAPKPVATPKPEPKPEPTVVSKPVVPEPDPAPAPTPKPAAAPVPQPESAPARTVTASNTAAADRVPDVRLDVQQATTVSASGDMVTIPFEAGGADLASDASEALATIVATLDQDSAARLQLKAYADGSTGSASAARRLSLSRALAVRSYLIDSGVSSTRIDVRALGAKYESGPPDRVDVISVK